MTHETIGFIALLIFFAVVGLGGMYFISRTDKAANDLMEFLKDSRDRGEWK